MLCGLQNAYMVPGEADWATVPCWSMLVSSSSDVLLTYSPNHIFASVLGKSVSCGRISCAIPGMILSQRSRFSGTCFEGLMGAQLILSTEASF